MSKRKLIDFYIRHEWTIAGLAFAGLVVLSVQAFIPCMGTCEELCKWTTDKPNSIADAVFFTLQMLVLNYSGIHGDAPWQIQIARFGLPALASATIIREIFKIAAHRGFPILIWNWNRHIVFCGGGDQARSLIRQYLKNGHRKIVVIDFSDALDTNELKREGVVILRENATFESTLLKARVKQASCVYIMAGSDQTNLAICAAFEKVIASADRSSGDPIKNCFLHVYDPTLENSLGGQFQNRRNLNATRGWEIRTFCTWENSARVLFTNHGPHLNTCFADDPTPHILILGHSWLAEQLIIQGARLGHYSGGRKLRITYVDENAASLRDRLYAQHPALDPKHATHMFWHPKELECLPVINTEFIAKAADSLTGELYARIIESAAISAAYICHSNNELALRTLAALRANLATPETPSKAKIVICDLHGLDLATLGNTGSSGCIETFDAIAAGAALKKNESEIDGFREDWARSIHQFYADKYPGSPSWEDLPDTMRDSNRECADHLKIKLDWLKPSSESDLSEKLQKHRMVLMQMEHERWNAERFMSGWRYCERPKSKEDEKKLKDKQQNWCLCTFENLSPSEQEKDKDIVWDIILKLYPRYQSEVLNS